MNMIDKLARKYNYTHDDVFKLEAQFAYQLILMNYEKEMYSNRAQDVRNEMNKTDKR